MQRAKQGKSDKKSSCQIGSFQNGLQSWCGFRKPHNTPQSVSFPLAVGCQALKLFKFSNCINRSGNQQGLHSICAVEISRRDIVYGFRRREIIKPITPAPISNSVPGSGT